MEKIKKVFAKRPVAFIIGLIISLAVSVSALINILKPMLPSDYQYQKVFIALIVLFVWIVFYILVIDLD